MVKVTGFPFKYSSSIGVDDNRVRPEQDETSLFAIVKYLIFGMLGRYYKEVGILVHILPYMYALSWSQCVCSLGLIQYFIVLGIGWNFAIDHRLESVNPNRSTNRLIISLNQRVRDSWITPHLAGSRSCWWLVTTKAVFMDARFCTKL
jgi:hypothetical protein